MASWEGKGSCCPLQTCPSAVVFVGVGGARVKYTRADPVIILMWLVEGRDIVSTWLVNGV